MSEEVEQEVVDDQASMESGFNSVRGGASSASDDYKSKEVEEAEPEDEAEPEVEPEEEESPVFAGFTERELKTLLERATRVDSIEDQLRKAHGKIGELHGTLKELQSRKPTPQAPAYEQDDEALSEFEETFPEFGPAVEARARKIAQEVLAQQPQSASIDSDAINKQVNLAVMDSTHKGWRNDVASEDFRLWISAQPQDMQETYQTTWDAQALGEIVSAYKGRQKAVSERSAKSRQRLENALTPDSRTQKVTHAITEQDAMQAGFDSVRNPRFYTR